MSWALCDDCIGWHQTFSQAWPSLIDVIIGIGPMKTVRPLYAVEQWPGGIVIIDYCALLFFYTRLTDRTRPYYYWWCPVLLPTYYLFPIDRQTLSRHWAENFITGPGDLEPIKSVKMTILWNYSPTYNEQWPMTNLNKTLRQALLFDVFNGIDQYYSDDDDRFPGIRTLMTVFHSTTTDIPSQTIDVWLWQTENLIHARWNDHCIGRTTEN